MLGSSPNQTPSKHYKRTEEPFHQKIKIKYPNIKKIKKTKSSDNKNKKHSKLHMQKEYNDITDYKYSAAQQTYTSKFAVTVVSGDGVESGFVELGGTEFEDGTCIKSREMHPN